MTTLMVIPDIATQSVDPESRNCSRRGVCYLWIPAFQTVSQLFFDKRILEKGKNQEKGFDIVFADVIEFL